MWRVPHLADSGDGGAIDKSTTLVGAVVVYDRQIPVYHRRSPGCKTKKVERPKHADGSDMNRNRQATVGTTARPGKSAEGRMSSP